MCDVRKVSLLQYSSRLGDDSLRAMLMNLTPSVPCPDLDWVVVTGIASRGLILKLRCLECDSWGSTQIATLEYSAIYRGSCWVACEADWFIYAWRHYAILRLYYSNRIFSSIFTAIQLRIYTCHRIMGQNTSRARSVRCAELRVLLVVGVSGKLEIQKSCLALRNYLLGRMSWRQLAMAHDIPSGYVCDN